ncbi:MAG: class I SAM-dependent methyltransferase [Bacteroidales bacterium]|nr:class I SAM-dependent methyltransferase [Bacteroidales bacterium]MDD4030926.1 class I SAM-dependent methyltransferase [Bacteroidales bacterium]MDD4435652.1 class I SAM-dependent methyltransferase [Bacteroidales bacterium]MDD5733439.1 class I SAM-dependent methyltransferase [Bacteroidales bacterium]HOZ20030.1 class I SAM-dependent methyltransferase [Bacteroidales bacterium]
MQLLCPVSWPDYRLLDCGNQQKLEQFGPYTMIRPEPKALWAKSLSDEQWMNRAHLRFMQGAGFAKAGKEDSGTWEKLKPVPDRWTIGYRKLFRLRLGLTAFKHVGVFPEQAPNWDYINQRVQKIREKAPQSVPRVLNLFAYTGAASLAARAAGAQVVHLDAVRQVITWGRENMELSGLDGIRWILEDAFRFVKREVRRGNTYQGLILDPPAYGHGPEGERWKLDDCLHALLQECAHILAGENAFMVLNLYSNGYSALLTDTLARASFPANGNYTFGELYLKDDYGKRLPLSVFSRMEL